MSATQNKSRAELQAERDDALRTFCAEDGKAEKFGGRIKELEARASELEHRPEDRAELAQVNGERQRYQMAMLNSQEHQLQAESRYHESQTEVERAMREEAGGDNHKLAELQAADRDQRGRVYAESAEYNYESPEVRKSMNTAMEYHDKHGSGPGDVKGWTEGTDLHKPVEIKQGEPGHRFDQRVRNREIHHNSDPRLYDSGRGTPLGKLEAPEDPERMEAAGERPVWKETRQDPGQYNTISGESPDSTGISGANRGYHEGRATERVEYLESTASPVKDTWTERGEAVETRGGAQQQYVGRDEMHKIDWKGREEREGAFERKKADAQWEKMTESEKDREAPSR